MVPGVMRRPATALGACVARGVGSRRLSAAAEFAANDPWESYRDHMFHFAPDQAVELLSPESASHRRSLRGHGANRCREGRRSRRVWTRLGALGRCATYLPDDLLTKMDRATMAFGIEARSPFLDHDLWDYVAALPLIVARECQAGQGDPPGRVPRRLAGLDPRPVPVESGCPSRHGCAISFAMTSRNFFSSGPNQWEACSTVPRSGSWFAASWRATIARQPASGTSWRSPDGTELDRRRYGRERLAGGTGTRRGARTIGADRGTRRRTQGGDVRDLLRRQCCRRSGARPWRPGTVALPLVVLAIAFALANLGMEQAQVYLAARGVPLATLWANSTLVGLVAGTGTWVVGAALLLTPIGRLGSPVEISWLVFVIAQVPLLLHVLYWLNLLQLAGRVRAGIATGLIVAGAQFVVTSAWPSATCSRRSASSS